MDSLVELFRDIGPESDNRGIERIKGAEATNGHRRSKIERDSNLDAVGPERVCNPAQSLDILRA
jgi:hypothetical protein